MDPFFFRFRQGRRLIATCAGILLVLVCSTSAVVAACDPMDQATAQQQCQAELAKNFSQGSLAGHYSCRLASSVAYGLWSDGGDFIAYFYFDPNCPLPPQNPCTALGNTSIFVTGKVTAGFTVPQTTTDSSGAQVQCGMTATPLGAPVWNPYSMIWQTYVSLTPSGNLASGNTVKDGSGNDAGIPVPSDFTNQNTTPSVCGTDSCYNPASDQYCASSGGSQFCVSGSTARATAGGCGGSNSVACAGSPTAPLPPASKIPDPATQVVGSDQYTQADPNTGATLPVIVNIYKAPTATADPSSGQQAGDSGPAPASSSPSNPSTYSGGGNCNSPPVCTGDAAMCGIARQQWLARCDANKKLDQLHTDLAGDGSSSPAINTVHSSSDVWTDGTHTGDPTADAANQGNYDASGLGFATQCPLHDLVVPLWEGREVTVPFSEACVVGEWISAIVLAFAAFAAAKITAGGMS